MLVAEINYVTAWQTSFITGFFLFWEIIFYFQPISTTSKINPSPTDKLPRCTPAPTNRQTWHRYTCTSVVWTKLICLLLMSYIPFRSSWATFWRCCRIRFLALWIYSTIWLPKSVKTFKMLNLHFSQTSPNI